MPSRLMSKGRSSPMSKALQALPRMRRDGRWSAFALAGMLTVAAAPSSHAQSDPAATAAIPANAPACTLHVWPGGPLRSTYTGWFHGGIVDGAVQGRDGYQQLPQAPLKTAEQRERLARTDLATALQLSGYRVVVHDQALDSQTLRSATGRLASDSTPCSAELAVADVFYQKAAIYGRSLRTLFMVRDFGADAKIDFEYKAWGGNGLKLFPPKEGEDAIAALDELASVFKKNFEEYAGNEAKAPRKPAA